VLQAKEHAPTFYFSVIFTLDSHLSLQKKLGAHQKMFIKIWLDFMLPIKFNVAVKDFAL
jgi:hypothetical protein